MPSLTDHSRSVPGQLSADRPPCLPAPAVVAELLRIAESVTPLCGMWRLAAAGYRPEHGPSEAVLINLRDFDPGDFGYDLGGLGISNYGHNPQHLRHYPDPLGVGMVKWQPFEDPAEQAKWRASLQADADSLPPNYFGDGLYAGFMAHAFYPGHVPEPDWERLREDGQSLLPEGHTLVMPGEAGDDDAPQLRDYLNERVRAAAALVPAERVINAVRPFVREWIAERIKRDESCCRHHRLLGSYSAWIEGQPDRDAAIDILAVGYLTNEAQPEVRFWLFAYALLRNTEHVWERSAGEEERIPYDAAAMIAWPPEAMVEVLMRLAAEAPTWVGPAGISSPPIPRDGPVPQPQKGRKKINGDGADLRLWEEWKQRGGTISKEDFAVEKGMDLGAMTKALDRGRHQAAKPRDAG